MQDSGIFDSERNGTEVAGTPSSPVSVGKDIQMDAKGCLIDGLQVITRHHRANPRLREQLALDSCESTQSILGEAAHRRSLTLR